MFSRFARIQLVCSIRSLDDCYRITYPRNLVEKLTIGESRHYLFGAMTKCLYHKKEETYLYKGFCLVWLGPRKGMKKTREVSKGFMGQYFLLNL